MNNILHILAHCFILFLLVGCDKQDAIKYDDGSKIYFYRGDRGYPPQDSTMHSFFFISDSKMRDTVYVDVRVMGMPSNIARSAKIVQSNIGKPGAAEPGTHYVAFDSPEMENLMFIPAGSVKLMMPVIFLKDPSMDTALFRLEMTVAANEYFTPGVKPEQNFMIKTTAMVEKPDTWNGTWNMYLGKWGPEKMKFIINYTGFSDFDEAMPSSFIQYLGTKTGSKLVEYNKNNPEYRVCEDKGKLHPGGTACISCVVIP